MPGQIVILHASEQPTQGHTGQDETDDRLEEDGTTLRAKANFDSPVVESIRSYDNFETCLDWYASHIHRKALLVGYTVQYKMLE